MTWRLKTAVAVGVLIVAAGCGGKTEGTFATVLSPVVTTKADDFGLHTSLALDADGNPLVAFAIEDENNDTNSTDSNVYFAGWNKEKSEFLAPVKVGEMNVLNRNNPHQNVALARDPKDGRLGVLWIHASKAAHMSTSTDGGKTWSAPVVVQPVTTGGHNVNNVALAMNDGKIYAAWWVEFARCGTNNCGATTYATGTEPGSLTQQQVPQLPNHGDRNMPISLALDSAGKPGLAFFQLSKDSASAYNTSLVFWRPGDELVKVTDSENDQNDGPSVALTFFGEKPRLAFHLERKSDEGDGNDLKVASSDDGRAFTMTTLPRDAEDSTDWWQSIAVDSKGNAAVVGNHNTSGAAGACGGPKLSRSNDKFEGWSTCGLDATAKAGAAGRYAKAAYTKDDRLVVVFQQIKNDDDVIKPGIVLWREE